MRRLIILAATATLWTMYFPAFSFAQSSPSGGMTNSDSDEVTSKGYKPRPTAMCEGHPLRATPYEMYYNYFERLEVDVRTCFEEAVQSGEYEHGSDGRMFISFDVDPGGSTTNFKVKEPWYTGTKLSQCIIDVIKENPADTSRCKKTIRATCLYPLVA